MATEKIYVHQLKRDVSDPDIAEQIDSICDAFESSWRAGTRPDLSSYLQRTNSPLKTLPLETLFTELVLIDISYRKRHGENPGVDEYARRFPYLQDSLVGLTVPLAGGADTSDSVPEFRNAVLGKFELVQKLGEGTFGIVWKARDHQLQRWVALKLFRNDLAGGPKLLLKREATAVAQIDHPNVVRIYEIGELSGQSYIAFQYVPGGTLTRWIKKQSPESRKQPVPPEKAAKFALQLAEGLKAVHACGVIHRDFKPGNILLDSSETLKIADFGLARHAGIQETISGEGVLMGTIPYMSPEQCRGKDITIRSDLYALGVILYEMLAGKLPFHGTQAELIDRIQKQTPAPPSQFAEVPASLENICLRALEKNPEDRYQSAEEFQKDLESYLNGVAVYRQSPPPLVKAQRFVKRHVLAIASAFMMVIGVATGLGALAYSSFSLPEDGKKEVFLESEPAGAKVAFIPLDPKTGIPQPEQIVHARGVTPVAERLLPGDYLVEVYMEDGSGRFHEVYRRVPKDGEANNASESFFQWSRDRQNPGKIILGRVIVPDASVVDGMALVSGNEQFLAGKEGDRSIPAHLRVVPSFYMDPTEVPLSAYQDTFDKHGDPDRRWVTPPTRDHAMTTKWHMAIFLLEKLGKRLPDEFEFEFAATKGGTQLYSWGNTDRPEGEDESTFKPVGHPQFDKVDYDKPIFGLGSNVAEWTMSWGLAMYPPYAEQIASEGMLTPSRAQQRIVRGGDHLVVEGNPVVNSFQRDPRLRITATDTDIHPGLGFRGVRSIRPRLKPEDFGRPVKHSKEN